MGIIYVDTRKQASLIRDYLHEDDKQVGVSSTSTSDIAGKWRVESPDVTTRDLVSLAKSCANANPTTSARDSSDYRSRLHAALDCVMDSLPGS